MSLPVLRKPKVIEHPTTQVPHDRIEPSETLTPTVSASLWRMRETLGFWGLVIIQILANPPKLE
jgi:hypothetical protein